MVEKNRLVDKIIFFLLVLLVVFFAVFPFVQMISTSLKYQWDWGNPSLIPRKINIEAYKELLNIGQEEKNVPESVITLLKENDQLSKAQKKAILDKFKSTGDIFPFFRYFANSMILSFSSAFISVAIAILGAYSFSRVRYRGRGLIQRGVLLVYMFGPILLLIPLYTISAKLGLISTSAGAFTTLMLIYMVLTLPVSLYMLGNYFRTIPFSIEESAMIEGCSRFGTIWRIVIPLSLSAIFTVFIYSFMIAWNEYLFASVFLKSFSDLNTLPLGLRQLFVSKNAIWDRIMAASMLSALPVIILFMTIQKQLAGGITAGGVKE
ncbi:MAG: carbohydrate ABC transporter permease [Spirochaetes bacterium]|nr:MAG: carbohydrate ABC transporter permease [Spirochaetota bacterium]